MMSMIKRLMGFTDRAESAAERVAVAWEGMAEDIESVREALRDRFGLATDTDTPLIETNEPVTTAVSRKKK